MIRSIDNMTASLRTHVWEGGLKEADLGMQPQGKGHTWGLGSWERGLQKVLEGRKQLNGEQLVAGQPWIHHVLLLDLIHRKI